LTIHARHGLRQSPSSGGPAPQIQFTPELACGLSVWRSVPRDEAEVMGEGLPFLRNKARQYGLI
jgi:hypothetical protein